MDQQFIETGASLDLEAFKGFETLFELKLPEDFKNHYLIFNGGCPAIKRFIYFDNTFIRINHFFSMRVLKHTSIEMTYIDLAQKQDFLPKGIIPFACEDCGNMFCISTREETYNKVYFCDCDRYELGFTDQHLFLITNTFDEFLAQLTTDKSSSSNLRILK